MFTGIVQAVGTILRVKPLEIDAGALDLSDVRVGDSICVQGVCLTVTAITRSGFTADVSGETLRVTTGLDQPGKVNLEKSLALGDKLGGHLVSGHVDGVGEIISRSDNARAIQFRVRAPKELAKYIAHKGSITVDGTSLTVNAVDGAEFELTIVPHTLAETIMVDYQAGRKVNLEVDLLARYLERLLLGDKAAEPKASGLTASFLAEHGYLNK